MQLRTLQTRGFVTYPYPADLRQAVRLAVSSWRSFCDLPPSAKQQFSYSNSSAGVGYEYKDGGGKSVDRKENFDITRASLAEPGIDGVAEHFIKHATTLVQEVKPLILNFARQCEEVFGLEDFVREVEASEDLFFIRFIHYFGDREVGQETASAHADQCGFTLHLFESAPGLQYLSHDGQWSDMPVSEGETVIIPAMQLQLRSQGALKALCHRVVATEATNVTGRYSAVCFVQLNNTPVYDKEKHGRLQEKAPGFNYTLPHAEFAELFKK